MADSQPLRAQETSMSNQTEAAKKMISPKALNSIAKKVASNFRRLYKGVKKGGRGSFQLGKSILRK